jgi:peptidyl-prolyl cis-trans isomerase C
MSCSLNASLAAASRTPVTVNGVGIAHDVIAREVQHHPGPTPLAGWQAAARALVVRELLVQEARRVGLSPDPIDDGEGRHETDEEALIRGLIEREVSVPEPDEATCRRYYEQNIGRFRSADIYEAAHILVAVDRNQPEARAPARELAASLIAMLNVNPGRFGELAKTHSACPSADAGGNLGQLTPGSTVEEFEKTLAAMSPGEISAGPVESRYGFHVIRLDRRIDGRQLPYANVAERIASYLTERSRRAATAQYIARLVSKSTINGIEMPTATDLRVY